jgi:hypothetical protein
MVTNYLFGKRLRNIDLCTVWIKTNLNTHFHTNFAILLCVIFSAPSLVNFFFLWRKFTENFVQFSFWTTPITWPNITDSWKTWFTRDCVLNKISSKIRNKFKKNLWLNFSLDFSKATCSNAQTHETSRFWREQQNDITSLWWLTECQINFCCCCYFWRGGCDWLTIFALHMTF